MSAASGIPANFIRVAWATLVLVLAVVEPVAFWLAVVPYLLAWYLNTRTATVPSAPAAGARGAPAQTTQRSAPPPAKAAERPGASLGERPYLQQFAQYLWTPETTPSPIYRTWSHGFVLSDLDVPKEKITNNLMFPRMPYGRIVVWPGWFVFMTESLNEPGKVPRGGKMLTVALDGYREYRRFASIFRVLRTAHATLTKEQRDILERALVNPNSIILPLSQVRSFHQERFALNPRLVIQTNDGRELMFGPNGLFEIGASFWRLAMGFFGPWHPQLHQILNEAANAPKER